MVGVEKALHTIVSGQPQAVEKLTGVVVQTVTRMDDVPTAIDAVLAEWKQTGQLRRTCDMAVPDAEQGKTVISQSD